MLFIRFARSIVLRRRCWLKYQRIEVVVIPGPRLPMVRMFLVLRLLNKRGKDTAPHSNKEILKIFIFSILFNRMNLILEWFEKQDARYMYDELPQKATKITCRFLGKVYARDSLSKISILNVIIIYCRYVWIEIII